MLESLPKAKAKEMANRIKQIRDDAASAMAGYGDGKYTFYQGYMESSLKCLEEELATGSFFKANP